MKPIISLELKNKLVENLLKFVGITTVIAIVGIFLNLILVSLPLFLDKDGKFSFSFNIEEKTPQNDQISAKLVFLEDEYVLLLTKQAKVKIFKPPDYKDFITLPLIEEEGKDLMSFTVDKNNMISAFFTDGSAKLISIENAAYENNQAIELNNISLSEIANFSFDPTTFKLGKAVYHDQKALMVVLDNQNQLTYQIISQKTNLFGITTETKHNDIIKLQIQNADNLILDKFASKIYLTNENGMIEGFEFSETPENGHYFFEQIADSKIISSTFLLGEKSIFLSLIDGSQLIIEPKIIENKPQIIFRYNVKNINQPPINKLKASKINRVVAGISDDKKIRFIYSTTQNEILKLNINSANITDFAISDEQTKLITINNQGIIDVYDISVNYPEANIRSYFGKVHYEGYLKPSYTWQSSSGEDSFEPKLSFWPLIIGSFKGTLYSIILILPLTILGAIYLSQFVSNKTRNKIKPVVEIMSSVPSVVIGFLAALWLGPNLEKYFLHSLIFIPTLLILAWINFIIWFKNPLMSKFKLDGIEFLLFIPPFLIALLITSYLGDYLLISVFDKDFTLFLYEKLNIRYEQQNAIVTAIALGIAVTPLIFSMTDDALKTVPDSIKAASLSLGASQWQTVWRVLVPSASPGIIAAIILGISRAVGETMIVLMASGNTPISDLNLFNGMRTLSANIAVEIPEAPYGGTLYRTLFLSGLLLFLITFIFNFLAEIIRDKLRKRYNN